jgi:hypothetical protein
MDSFFDLQNKMDPDKRKDSVRKLAESVYSCACQQAPDMLEFRRKLENLLVFLCSPEGHTHENCCLVDTYFCSKSDWPNCIEHLPRDVHSILFDIGMTLHDAVKCPDIAKNFESLPEQLLDRLRKLKI